ncbi:aspartate-semialdehyde dehydrogenase [Psychromonas antarctica]|jgi:aspartate-semialdehyde dehydrogenase|uniref:aspartate-semialdehyde dehydrogenase n=1 Tax=Psychromonas antarctica TaxID=67573 RepID=UPI001EE88277|nr:Asd/ArgC dimerization domain-containing protein [Psychromonas antarctica]MCG6200585.1 aspartate-semialdehyde dehydrogenase [Psychromonas antarctica]
MKSEYNIALIGELNGSMEITLEVLAARNFPVAKVFPLVSGGQLFTSAPIDESENEFDDEELEPQANTVMFAGKPLDVIDLDNFDWQKADIALFLTDTETTLKWADIASEYCVVIDNSGAFLADEAVPLVQIGVNDDSLGGYAQTNKIAIPSSESAQLAIAIKQLHQEVGLLRVSVSSYHSVSASGKAGVTTLAGETARLLNAKSVEPSLFPQQSAFNVFPQLGDLNAEGISLGELRLVNEIRTLLGDPSIIVSSTQVVVPMFYGCAQAVHLQTHYPVDLEEVAHALHHSDGISLSKSVCDYPDMISDVIGHADVKIGRLRKDVCDANGINLWVCADNVYFGIASNAVKVAEKLIQTYL